MKLVKAILATTLTLSAFSAFAATEVQDEQAQAIVSTQDQPVNVDSAAAQPTTAQPGSEVAAEEGVQSPEATAKPIQ